MARDPDGNKIGSNDPCWCGSGNKYKRCHYNREMQKSLPFGFYENKMAKVERETNFCSCEFDKRRCVAKIVKAHSVSKSSSLSEIEADGHVLKFELMPSALHDHDLGYEHVIFKKVGINLASTFRAFCEYHDHALFKELDRLEFGSLGLFFWQLFYRTLCFERYRKLVVSKFVPQMRGLDRGKPQAEQRGWQQFIDSQQFAHSMGHDDLNGLRGELEALFQAGEYTDELKYISYLIPKKLPLAASGVFQPDLNINGDILQRVNEFYEVDGKFVAPPLDSICMSILPFKSGTILSFCALRKHRCSVTFMQTFRTASKSIVDNFVGLAVLRMENVYFDPAYISSIPERMKAALRRLHSFGTGVDVKPNEMALAMRLGLFSHADNIECIHNLDM